MSADKYNEAEKACYKIKKTNTHNPCCKTREQYLTQCNVDPENILSCSILHTFYSNLTKYFCSDRNEIHFWSQRHKLHRRQKILYKTDWHLLGDYKTDIYLKVVSPEHSERFIKIFVDDAVNYRLKLSFFEKHMEIFRYLFESNCRNIEPRFKIN